MGQIREKVEKCIKFTLGIFFILVILYLVIGLPLTLIFAIHGPKKPTFTVESTVVKAYNLTLDNRLFCIINLGIRAHNPNPKKHGFDFIGIDMEVRKGKHHKLGDDRINDFTLGPTGETVVPVEAVGLLVDVKKKIVAELMADLVAAEGRVNVFMSGYAGRYILGVTCKNVVVDFSRSTVVAQSLGCKVTLTAPNDGA